MFDLFNSFAVEKFDTESGKNIHNAIFANGIFQQRKSPIGTFVIPTELKDFKSLGLTKECETSFTPDHSEIPKIPTGLLQQVIVLYRNISKTIKSEVYCAIVWNKIKKDFFIHVPKQEVSAATINYTNTPEIYSSPDLVVVMDIHSHVNMSAFFSSVDLKDETATRYFGVIGKIDNELPEMVVRAASNGKEIKLNIEDIFSDALGVYPTSDYTVPESDYANITEFAPVYTGTYGVGKTGTGGYNSGWTDADYEDYYSAQGWKVYPNNQTKTTTSQTSNFYSVKNPFNDIYGLINKVRYGVKYSESVATEFAAKAIACILKYADESGATVQEVYELSDKLERLVADEFAKTIISLSEDSTTIETTNVNQSKCS